MRGRFIYTAPFVAKQGAVLVSMLFVAGLLCANATSVEAAKTLDDDIPSATEVIELLGLEGHVEGGFYRRTYEATDKPRVNTEQGERFSMTSIFYLLTAEGPIGHFHLNRADIVHYFQLGDPIDYFLIHPDGQLEQRTMGPDPRQGHLLQMTVPGGVWKASRVTQGASGYGLISEAVSPGFDFSDMTLGKTPQMLERFPEHEKLVIELSR